MRLLIILSFFVCLLAASSCGPNATQKKLIEEISTLQKSLEENLTAIESNAEYLAKEQAEFEAKNKALRKKLGKADSLYGLLVKSHGKLADALKEKTDKLKSINDEFKSFIEKLNAPISVTYDSREIQNDFGLLKSEMEKLIEETKPAMPEHERLEDEMKERLLTIEAEKTASTVQASKQTSAKSSAQKKTKP